MNFHFKTLGCKVNQYETQAMTEAIKRLGHTADPSRKADAVIINSCTVTAESDRKTRQLLRRMRSDNSDALIILTGCMVQAFPEKANALGEADIIVGNRDINKIIQLISEYKGEKTTSIDDHRLNDSYIGLPISSFDERTRAFIKIEDGCDRYCSYCIIPKARGHVRSKPINDIISEATALANNGYLEIVLVWINLSAYGNDTGYDLCDAVDAVCGVEGIKRVRLGSLEPDHITDEMLIRLKSQDKFCPQFHLSLQSGCDKTLKRMNRHYDTCFYSDLVSRIRKCFNDAAITTDIMVGFAGESEDEFSQSVQFVKNTGFARSHIFAYSRREGTVAAALPGQVTNAEKQRRAKVMASAAKESEYKFLLSQLGKTYPVLFETENNGEFAGYTPNYTKVTVKSEADLHGQMLPVVLTEAFDDHCRGELIAH